jgi:PTS system glucitol/sorbitol-specific IIA component
MDYKTTVTGFGELYAELYEQGMIVVFNDTAPKELAELSVLHTVAALNRDVRPGDTVLLGNKTYRVSAVGKEANHTLGKMGHCTFVFTGAETAELDGRIVLKGDGMPEIRAGDPFEIYFA